MPHGTWEDQILTSLVDKSVQKPQSDKPEKYPHLMVRLPHSRIIVVSGVFEPKDMIWWLMWRIYVMKLYVGLTRCKMFFLFPVIFLNDFSPSYLTKSQRPGVDMAWNFSLKCHVGCPCTFLHSATKTHWNMETQWNKTERNKKYLRTTQQGHPI